MENYRYQLPKAFATKWVEALRSGEYKQGTGYLSFIYRDSASKVEIRYCCLGVACSMVGIPDNLLKIEFVLPHFNMPKELIGDRVENGLVQILTNMNDREGGKSFLEIADWIEANVQFI
ncbi:hypothetical protein [Mucilaginibacter sp. 10I4]|uniref:hypothetical protein n=1 Tax=Mucilaginibacter sp. 10I4 TaxID=3048580 RepID=UPI002B227020|nr:hypothetical protein [Mucilaginibacter sp. 10I4]MEB0262874.1 hypothetical protein [Mucilaginibacter sp. 10I4]